MKFASKTRGRERAPNSVVLFASIYKRKNSFIIHFLLFINKKAGFGNQQNKFETTKRLRGGTPLNASLYTKGATIVAPRYHEKERSSVAVQAAACYFLISLWRVLRLSDGLYFIFSTFLPSGLRGLRVVI